MINEFIAFLLLGFIIGALYDFFRFLRFLFCKKWNQFFIDFLFFVVVSILFFIFLLAYNNGIVRYYYFTYLLIGSVLYFLTLFKLSKNMEIKIACFFRKLAIKLIETFKKVLHFNSKMYYNKMMLRRNPLRKKEKNGD